MVPPEAVAGHVVNGLCPPRTYELLMELAATVDPSLAVVELGTYKGHGTVALIRGAFGPVFTVDTHDLPGERSSTAVGPGKRVKFTDPAIRKEAEKRIDGRATMIRSDSCEAGEKWDGPDVGLLMIDADHREGALRRDFTAWERHLYHGAIVCFDDYHSTRYPGVVTVVSNLLGKGAIHSLSVYGTLAVAVKK